MNNQNHILHYLKEISISKTFTKQGELEFFTLLHQLGRENWLIIIETLFRSKRSHLNFLTKLNEKRSFKKLNYLFTNIHKSLLTVKILRDIADEEFSNKPDIEIINEIIKDLPDEMLFSEIPRGRVSLRSDPLFILLQNYTIVRLDHFFSYDLFVEFETFYQENLCKSNRWPKKLKKEFQTRYRRNLLTLDQMRNKFATGNLKLVVTISKNYLKSNIPWADVIQEGNLGLLKAIEKYDYRTGNRFSTYAIWWIKQSIVRALIEKGNTIRIPLHLIDSYNKIKKIMIQHFSANNRFPDLSVISAEANIPLEKINKIFEYLNIEFVSLNAPVNRKSDDSQILYEEVVEDHSNVDPLKRLETDFIVAFIQENLDKLTEMQRKVLMLRYGFEEEHFFTLEEIGIQYNLSRERIRQIQEKALIKLRSLIKKSNRLLRNE